MKKSAIIIGGGIGGLFTGALLAKNGFKVTILEKNSIIGGGLQCFRRRGKIFETGMHVLGGFTPEGTLTRICRYLGVHDKLELQQVPGECMDEIHYEKTGEVFKIPSGKKEFINRMSEYFPSEAEGIRKYVEEIYRISEEVPLFYLKEEKEGIPVHSENFVRPADHLIRDYVKDERLREILAYLNPLYGGISGHTPAYIHALINVLYINGATRFVGGSQQLADALKEVVVENEGRVEACKQVKRMDIENRHIRFVETSDGDRYSGDYYISAIHPLEMLRMVPEGTFLKGFIRRLNEIPLSCSAFTLFIDLKPQSVPYIDHMCYYMESYGEIWCDQQARSKDWPVGFMYMTPPEPDQGEWASRLLVHCIMDYDDVRQWEQTSVGRRGDEYEKWKEERVDKIVNKIERVIPGIREKSNHIYAASPLTIRDYYHTPEGAIFGNRKDCENIMLSQLPVFTKVDNLLLTGQNVNLHGICGVPLTAINTAEAILGLNFIVKRINEEN